MIEFIKVTERKGSMKVFIQFADGRIERRNDLHSPDVFAFIQNSRCFNTSITESCITTWYR